jgi:hypothetical protein
MEEQKKAISAPSYSREPIQCLADLAKDNPFSRIAKVGPTTCIPEKAQAEWNLVKNESDAKNWHLKWTPWFTPTMIDGIVKFGYFPK